MILELWPILSSTKSTRVNQLLRNSHLRCKEKTKYSKYEETNHIARGKGKSVPAKATIEGVPICEKYKYLGTILTPQA